MQEIYILCVSQIQESDVPIFDLMLESLGRRGGSDLKIRKLDQEDPRQHIFSSQVLRQFLVENDRLKALTSRNVWIGEEQSDIIGRFSRGLDSIEIRSGVFEMQHFANGVGANTYGPQEIFLRSCCAEKLDVVFSSFIGPLLGNPRLKVLRLYYITMYDTGMAATIGSVEVIKAAFQSNQNLEQLLIFGVLFIQVDQLKMLLHGIASAPKLRTLSLTLLWPVSEVQEVRPQEISEMLANALKECKNSSLEGFEDVFSVGQYHSWGEESWDREVAPIFEFNRERRLFRENACSFSNGEQLLRALVLADRTDNHHLRYWLVRDHAGDLRPRESEQAQCRLGKRKQIPK
jgi:hypothetical protein